MKNNIYTHKLRYASALCLLTLLVSATGGASYGCLDTDPIGDGWGWDGARACRVSDSNQPVCVDSDGDGWGWDGSQTCLADSVAVCQHPDLDYDGDGWGWENGESCRTIKTKRQIRVSFTMPPELTFRQGVSAGIVVRGAGWGHRISDTLPFSVTRPNPIAVPFDETIEIDLMVFAAPPRYATNSTYVRVARYRRQLSPGTADIEYDLTAENFDLSMDDDSDGTTNLDEVLSGTDPRTPD